jgi:hypothetical protein
MKNGSGNELKGLSSFDKQEKEIEFSEFKAMEYSNAEFEEDIDDMPKEPRNAMTSSIIDQRDIDRDS